MPNCNKLQIQSYKTKQVKLILLSATFMHGNMRISYIIQDETKPSARDLFFFSVFHNTFTAVCKLAFITSTHLLSSPIAKLQKKASWIKKRKKKKNTQTSARCSLLNEKHVFQQKQVKLCVIASVQT